MKDFGCIKTFSGFDIEFVGQEVQVNQKKYAETILQRFNMDECNSKQIPCDMNAAKLDFDDDSEMLSLTHFLPPFQHLLSERLRLSA